MKGSDRLELAAEFCLRLKEDETRRGEPNPLEIVSTALPETPRPTPAVGQVWRVSDPQHFYRDALLALTHVSNEVIRGVVAVEDLWLAGHDDMIVAPSDSPTGDVLVLCVWSDTPVSLDLLAGFVGPLGAGILEPLLMYLQQTLTGGYQVRARTNRQCEGLPVVTWEIFPAGTPEAKHTFTTGSRVLDPNEPRAQARKVVADATQWIGDLALEDLWSRCGAPVRPSYGKRTVAKIRKVIDELTKPVVVPDSPSVAGASVVFEPIGAVFRMLQLAVDGSVVGAALNRQEKSDTEGPIPSEPSVLRFAVRAGTVIAKVTVDAGETELLIAVLATKHNKPVPGFQVSFNLGPPSAEMKQKTKTDARGRALISFPWPDDDVEASGKLILGAGDTRLVIEF